MMNGIRMVKAGELFATFIFDGRDCADMGVYSVTNGSVYTMNIEPTFGDNNLEVPAYDGRYYYGTQITGQQFQFDCFCHDLTSTEYDSLKAWLHPRKIGRLILSDQPYKYYLVKVASISSLGAIPLTTIQIPQYSVLGDFLQGEVVYTGSFQVTFETVGSAYGYGLSYYRDDLIYNANEKYGLDYYYNTGLLYKDMNPRLQWDVEANAKDQDVPMFNPGSAAGQPIYIIHNTATLLNHTFIQLNDANTGTSTVIDVGGITGNIYVDTMSQVLRDDNDNIYYGRFSGTRMEISPRPYVIEIPETFVDSMEDTDLLEYDSFYIQNNIVSINPKVLEVNQDLLGQYFCVCENGGAKIVAYDKINNTITLDSSVTTYDIPPAIVQDGTVIRPAGMAFNYIEVDNVMPSGGNLGEVCVVNHVCYVYLYNEWKVCTFFSGSEDFLDALGHYQTRYKVFGATIMPLDKLTITTGTNIKYRYNGSTITGASMPAFTLEAELQPRYL